MSNEELFYICGAVLAVSALVVSFAGLKVKSFPGRAFPLVIVWFAVFVLGATTFAVRYSAEEKEHEEHKQELVNEEIEKDEGDHGSSNEGAAEVGGEEEPVGPTEGSQEGGGAGANAGGAGAATTLDLAADETALAYDKNVLAARPGKITIDFTNPSVTEHNVVIERNGKELAGFDPISEGEESLSVELEPGSYTFFCSVAGHEEAGMKGTLVIK